jgi:hypothetical protein
MNSYQTKQTYLIKCPLCEGKQYTFDNGERLGYAVCTFGILNFFDYIGGGHDPKNSIFGEKCRLCKGNGHVNANIN